jgi:hypothetical protein
VTMRHHRRARKLRRRHHHRTVTSQRPWDIRYRARSGIWLIGGTWEVHSPRRRHWDAEAMILSGKSPGVQV